MEAIEAKWKRKVFRLRGLPNYVSTCSEVANALSKGFRISTTDIDVKSLATTLQWENPPSKVATLQFNAVPSALRSHLDDEEWDLSPWCLTEFLTLDCHFLGLTPLNDVKGPEEHTVEYAQPLPLLLSLPTILTKLGKLHCVVWTWKPSFWLLATSWTRQKLYVDSR